MLEAAGLYEQQGKNIERDRTFRDIAELCERRAIHYFKGDGEIVDKNSINAIRFRAWAKKYYELLGDTQKMLDMDSLVGAVRERDADKMVGICLARATVGYEGALKEYIANGNIFRAKNLMAKVDTLVRKAVQENRINLYDFNTVYMPRYGRYSEQIETLERREERKAGHTTLKTAQSL